MALKEILPRKTRGPARPDNVEDAAVVSEGWSAADLEPRICINEFEKDNAFHVEMELPGMDHMDVEVSFSDGLLIICGDKKPQGDGKVKNYYRQERTFGVFRRVLPIPGAVNQSGIQARLSKGVLSIELPKSEVPKRALIKIPIAVAD